MDLNSTTQLAAPPHEFAALEHILLGDLRELLEGDLGNPQTRRWLQAVLNVLADMLPCQLALEQHGRSLGEERADPAVWEDAVQSLHRQHEELLRGLTELRSRLADDRQLGSVAAGVRVDLRNWMERYHSHQQAAAELLDFAADSQSEPSDDNAVQAPLAAS